MKKQKLRRDGLSCQMQNQDLNSGLPTPGPALRHCILQGPGLIVFVLNFGLRSPPGSICVPFLFPPWAAGQVFCWVWVEGSQRRGWWEVLTCGQAWGSTCSPPMPQRHSACMSGKALLRKEGFSSLRGFVGLLGWGSERDGSCTITGSFQLPPGLAPGCSLGRECLWPSHSRGRLGPF